GSPSSGKSTLIRQIIAARSNTHSNPIFLWDCHFWTDEREFFQDLSAFLASETSSTSSSNRNSFLNLLNAKRTNAFWLILDHVDELPSTDLIEFLVKASELANGKISFLFASRKPSYSIDNVDAFPVVLPEHDKNIIL